MATPTEEKIAFGMCGASLMIHAVLMYLVFPKFKGFYSHYPSIGSVDIMFRSLSVWKIALPVLLVAALIFHFSKCSDRIKFLTFLIGGIVLFVALFIFPCLMFYPIWTMK